MTDYIFDENQMMSIPIDHCLVCDSNDLMPYVDLGCLPFSNCYSSDALSYPLGLNYCRVCDHSQLSYQIFGVPANQDNPESIGYELECSSDPLALLTHYASFLSEEDILSLSIQANDMLECGGFDSITHNRKSYFTLSSLHVLLARTNLKVLSCGRTDNYYNIKITKPSWRNPRHNLVFYDLIEIEENNDYYDERVYRNFQSLVERTDNFLEQVVDLYSDAGYIPIAYGASHEANTIINYCDARIDCVVTLDADISNQHVPGTRIPIIKFEEIQNTLDPLAIFIVDWRHYDLERDRILSRRNGRHDIFIQCFPKPQVSW